MVETLAAPDAVLVIDATGFLKQGKASCGLGRHYTGSAENMTNCQIGVSAADVSAKGSAFIGRRLSLPKGWTDAPARSAAAHVPAEDGFATATSGLGLDRNETRSRHGWHRHVAPVMLTVAVLAVIRHRANTTMPPPTSAAAERCRRGSAGRSRRYIGSPAA